jgi:hypothetical protein
MNLGRTTRGQYRGAQSQSHLRQVPTSRRKTNIVQLKPNATLPTRRVPQAPPVYRPQPVPRVLQKKMSVPGQTIDRSIRTPLAPPVYCPQTTPRVLQRKIALVERSALVRAPGQPISPPIYRPQPTPTAVQMKEPRTPTAAHYKSTSIQRQMQERAQVLREQAGQSRSPSSSNSGAVQPFELEAGRASAGRRVVRFPPVARSQTAAPALQRLTANAIANLRFGPSVSIGSRPQPSGVIQRALTEAGTAYLQHIQTTFTYGGLPEAHVIATNLGFQTRVFDLHQGRLRLLSAVGAGNVSNLSLFWDRQHQHYKVLTGGAVQGQLFDPVQNQNLIAHDPTGDGNCMYEAMYYIYRQGDATIVGELVNNPQRRAQYVRRMRTIAAENFDPVLANILGEELMAYDDDVVLPTLSSRGDVVKIIAAVYESYSPKVYYLVRNKEDYDFYTRSNKTKASKKNLDAELRDDYKVKDKDLRKAVLAALSVDRSYFLEKKEVKLDLKSMEQLIDDKDIKVYIDHHQDKHQHPDSAIYGAWKHKRGSSFASGKGRKWHEQNTAETIKSWALEQSLKEGDTRYPKKVPMSDGYIYDAAVMLLKGIIYVAYHCNPMKSEK